jgi:hypothetical protein
MIMYTATIERRSRTVITIKPDVLLPRIISIRLLDSGAPGVGVAASCRKKKEVRKAFMVIMIKCC